MVIVNKKPHFKLVPLLIFQFPNPATLNNWLSHLLNLYSSITYLYSSSIHFFCLLIFFFLLFFFFFPPLSQGHMKQKNGSCCPFRPVSAGISLFRLESACFGGRFGHIDSCFCQNWPGSAHFGPNWRESGRVGANKKEKKKGESAS